MKKYACLILLALLSACATTQQAPVVERAPAAKTPVAKAGSIPDTYVVKKGDTLYSIGTAYGIGHKDLALWNGIAPPYSIHIGQPLKLRPSQQIAAAPATPPVQETPGVVTTPIAIGPGPAGKPLEDEGTTQPAPAASTAPKTGADGIPLLTAPQAVKRPYSEATMAAQPEPGTATAEATASSKQPEAATASEDEIVWAWPATGKILAGFNDTTTAKGLDIAGTQGQPVLAAANGKVVYSGSGLRGYGNLIIIKHNQAFLSAYAHNSRLLVKEGQAIVKGQKIAEMGSSDSDQVKLHFEIRKLGKPVDPTKYLPSNPS